MPGVRYGPDISDDAAFIIDAVKELQAKLRKGLTLSKDRKGKRGEATILADYKRIAKDIFGVNEKDFDRGRFGDLAAMARYGADRDRSEFARSWRTGKPMKKGVTDEFVDRGIKGGRRAGSVNAPDTAYYMGRTRSKGFRNLEGKIQRRMNRNGTSYGKTTIPKRGTNKDNFLAQVDSLNITRARGKTSSKPQSDITNRPLKPAGGRGAAPGGSIRPPLPKNAIAAEKRRRAASGTKAARDLASKGKKPKTAGKPKTGGKPKKPR